MKLLILLILISLVGCSRLSTKMYDQLEIGDSEEKLFNTMGDYDRIGKKDLASTTYVYSYRNEDCYVKILNKLIAQIECEQGSAPIIVLQPPQY